MQSAWLIGQQAAHALCMNVSSLWRSSALLIHDALCSICVNNAIKHVAERHGWLQHVHHYLQTQA